LGHHGADRTITRSEGFDAIARATATVRTRSLVAHFRRKRTPDGTSRLHAKTTLGRQFYMLTPDLMDLDELRVFVSIVERGSLAAASKSLRFPMATLRRRLDELEARLGVKLLERSRNGAVPTNAGVVLAQKASSLLRDMQALSDVVRESAAEATAEIGLALPPGLPPAVLASIYSVLSELFPSVRWRLRSVEDPTTILSGEFHAAICFAERAPDGPWVAKRLIPMDQCLLASREYLRRHGTPTTPEDLQAHRLIVWEHADLTGHGLPMLDGSKLLIAPCLRMNDVFLVRQLAARNLGIAFAPDVPLPVELLLGDEHLVRVLEDRIKVRTGVWLLASAEVWQVSRVRVALEHVVRLMASIAN
jgi:DNA-binding transcriptional LysR family regulator